MSIIWHLKRYFTRNERMDLIMIPIDPILVRRNMSMGLVTTK